MTDDTKFTPDMFWQRASGVAKAYARALRDYDKSWDAFQDAAAVANVPVVVPNRPVKPKIVLTQMEEHDLRTDFNFWTTFADVLAQTLHGRLAYSHEIEVTRDDR